jgi:hypothetical protein
MKETDEQQNAAEISGGNVHFKQQSEGRQMKESEAYPRWATRSQIAKRYAVHPGTIDTWRRSGFLPAFVFGSRLVRFDIKACDTWFHTYRQGAKWE